MYHNIGGSVDYKLDYIMNDYGFKACDIIMLSECHVKIDRNHLQLLTKYNVLEEFSLVRLTGGCTDNTSYGMCLYVRKDLIQNNSGRLYEFEFVADNSSESFVYPTNNSNCTKLEISLFKLTTYVHQNFDVYICYLYNHPKNSFSLFWQEFKSFLKKHLTISNDNIIEKIIVIGDFNFDLNKSSIKQECSKLFDKYKFEIVLNANQLKSSTDRQTYIDWSMSNFKNDSNSLLKIDSYFYESIYSDHKPIVTNLKKNFLIKN